MRGTVAKIIRAMMKAGGPRSTRECYALHRQIHLDNQGVQAPKPPKVEVTRRAKRVQHARREKQPHYSRAHTVRQICGGSPGRHAEQGGTRTNRWRGPHWKKKHDAAVAQMKLDAQMVHGRGMREPPKVYHAQSLRQVTRAQRQGARGA